MGKRNAFVNYGNSREGKAIADALKEEGFFVYSTRRPDPQKLDHLQPDPLSVDQFIPSDVDTIVATLKTCNVVIYTILDTPKLAVEIFTRLNEEPGVRKRCVIVSPMFTWAGEPKAEDWHKRWPHVRYPDFLAAERYLTASLQLRLYVMCVGLLYGDGEGPLLPLFESAWHLKPAPMLEQNHNVIPTLHVKDMARGAVALSQSPPEIPVIIAHDGSNTNQRELVKAINQAFGAGRTPKKTEAECLQQLQSRETVDWMMLDIELEAAEFSGLDFERHCSSPVEEIQTLVDEFVAARLLTSFKILSVRLPTQLVNQIVDYYGLQNATIDNMKDALLADKSEEAIALKESAAEDENENEDDDEEKEKTKKDPREELNKIPQADIIKHVLTNCPAFKNQGFILSSKFVPKDEEERDNLFMDEGEETSTFMPKYILTWNEEFGAVEKWFISKGSHCCTVKCLKDVQKFLGLPHNFTRNVQILKQRRILEQMESEKADNERKRLKKEKEEEEARKKAMMERDAELLKEVEAELQSTEDIRNTPTPYFLKHYIVPMFLHPLRQIAEATPDDPLRFLASHFEKESQVEK